MIKNQIRILTLFTMLGTLSGLNTTFADPNGVNTSFEDTDRGTHTSTIRYRSEVSSNLINQQGVQSNTSALLQKEYDTYYHFTNPWREQNLHNTRIIPQYLKEYSSYNPTNPWRLHNLIDALIIRKDLWTQDSHHYLLNQTHSILMDPQTSQINKNILGKYRLKNEVEPVFELGYSENNFKSILTILQNEVDNGIYTYPQLTTIAGYAEKYAQINGPRDFLSMKEGRCRRPNERFNRLKKAILGN